MLRFVLLATAWGPSGVSPVLGFGVKVLGSRGTGVGDRLLLSISFINILVKLIQLLISKSLVLGTYEEDELSSDILADDTLAFDFFDLQNFAL